MNRMRNVTSGEVPGRRTVGIFDGEAVDVAMQNKKRRPEIIPLLAEEGRLRRAKRRRRRGGRIGEMSRPA